MTDDRDLDEAIRQLPRAIDPPEDLWPAIRTRVDARERSRRRTLVAGVLAAAAAVALWFAMTPTRAPTHDLVAGWTAAVPEPERPSPPVDRAPEPSDLIPGEAQLRGAATELASAYDRRRPLLDRELLAVYEENLGIVDDAIERSRAALVQHPADPHLQRVLDRAYRHKLALLRRASSEEGPR
jgi:hypothetical protein